MFYDNWKKKTKLEKAGIVTLKLAQDLIFENVSRDEIVSIYVKGSFPRREMNVGSDVDTLIVLRTKKYLSELRRLDKWGKSSGIIPYPQFAGYSLWELKTGKRIGKGNGASPSRVVKHLKEYELIFGEDLTKKNLYMREDKDDFEKMVRVFREKWLPDYEKGAFDFGMLVKQTFWLIENEQRVKGNTPPHAWKKLRDSIKNKKHIIYDAWEIRNNPKKDKVARQAVRKKFIVKLKKYLEKVD